MKIWMNTNEDADVMGIDELLATAKPATLEEVAETLDKLSDERHAKCEWNYYIPTFRQIDNNLVFWLMEDEPHF